MEKEALLEQQSSTDTQLSDPFREKLNGALTSFLSSTPKLESACGKELTADQSQLIELSQLLQAVADSDLIATSESQLCEFKHKLTVKSKAFVKFGDFVDCSKEVFQDKLFDINRLSGILDFFKKCDCQIECNLRHRNNILMQEITCLKRDIKAMENACSRMEIELVIVRKELQCRIECSRSLGQKIKCEEAIKKASCNKIDQIKLPEEKLKLVPVASQETPKDICLTYLDSQDLILLKHDLLHLMTSNVNLKNVNYKMINLLEDLQNVVLEILQESRFKGSAVVPSLIRQKASDWNKLKNSPLITCNTVADDVLLPTSTVTDTFSGKVDCEVLIKLVNKTKDVISHARDVLRNETQKFSKSCYATKYDQTSWPRKKKSENPVCSRSSAPIVTIISRV